MPDELAARIAARLIARKETVAVAESSAGGLVAAALLAVPGASAYFLGGAVVYTITAREALLGITKADMTGLRPASEPYARLISGRMREKFASTWAIAETGATGPTGNRYGDAAGHACFGIAGPVPLTRALETGLTDRAENMRRFTRAALEAFDEALAQAS
jgi:PncC family amidohydrolase